MNWPFSKRPKAKDPVSELGTLVRSGGLQIAKELTEFRETQKETQEKVARLESRVIETQTDTRDMSHLVQELLDGQAEQNEFLNRLALGLPADRRPTPLPTKPGRIPRPPRVPNIGVRRG